MDGYKLGVVETRFAELIWQHEPLTSGELVKLCEQELQWKKSTTYTVLKKLCEHGIFQNENGTVTSLLSQEGYNAVQSEKFVEETYRAVLEMRLLLGYTGKEIAQHLALSESAVNTRIFRGRALLREIAEKEAFYA